MPTRKILLHISPLETGLFYLLAALALAVAAYGVFRHLRRWRNGQPLPKVTELPRRLSTLLRHTLGQERVRRRRLAGATHAAIFFGFLALFIGTTIVAIEHYGALVFGEHWFYKGAFYLATKLCLDVFGAGLAIGVGVALVRRWRGRPESLGNTPYDTGFLLLVLAATLTGFWLEGAGLKADPTRQAYAAFSPFGLAAAPLAPSSYPLVWWVHVVLVLAVIAVLPYGKRLHVFVIPASLVLQPERPMGVLEPVSLEEVEATGKLGLMEAADLDFWQRLSLDGCMECGRCTDACPAHAVGKALDPKAVVLALREAKEGPLERLTDEVLWACTNCHACVRECPAVIRHVDLIDGMRRARVAEGRLSGSGATALRQLGSRQNPWGLPNSQRLDWAKGLEVPLATADDNREILFWVGCSGAFEPRAQKTVRAVAELLTQAGVRFAVLGPKERCSGDTARRLGDELLFQQLAEGNIKTLESVKATRIVTQCPHCLHTLKNEYGAFGGNYEVLHHTELLAELQAQGRLPQAAEANVTYHDPCFLARVNGITEPPRKLLPLPMLEPPRTKDKTFCCGAGGGRMWMEEAPEQRPGRQRAAELVATGAETIAVGCPFCNVMLSDSVAALAGETGPEVVDIAELVLRTVRKKDNDDK